MQILFFVLGQVPRPSIWPEDMGNTIQGMAELWCTKLQDFLSTFWTHQNRWGLSPSERNSGLPFQSSYDVCWSVQ